MKYHLTPAIRAAWDGDTPPELNLINWAKQFTDGTGTFIDIGAHVGSWSCEMAGCFERTVSIEPQSDVAQFLETNLHDAGVQGYRLEFAIGDAASNGSVLTRVSADGGGSSLLRGDVIPRAWQGQLEKPETKLVRVRTLDYLIFGPHFGGNLLPKVKMIKVDVEGYEIQALQGARGLIERDKPVILFECWQGEWFATQRAALFAYVRDVLKYRITPIGGWDEMFLAEPLL